MRLRTGILLLAFIFSTILSTLFAQSKSQAYINYVQNYYKLAMIQQKEHGIPASITLAQGLLESGAGMSELARKSNNHFGIKCHDWSGEKTYHDDDERGECFRKYDKVLDSYEDHSAFLKNRTRYAFLFELSPTDYQAWAHGLKKAGYATDPSYAY
ncbi:MAG: glucosaminidase domain-containing protein, partial [Paludibacter sp.]|nr:glucosaminidase domain-containing protein [Paludibacter sp.]